MKALLQRIVEWTDRQALLTRGDRVGVAVSGGADSVCLLHQMRELAPRYELTLSVLHVDHQLRGAASRADAEFVGRLAAGMGLDFHLERVTLSDTDGGTEQAARQARLDFFHRLVRTGLLDKVATGHTLSDQAETVLHRLVRGSGGSGLRGILPRTAEGIIRPMLPVHRVETEAWLRERGMEWRTDETNFSREFLRNRIRLDLMPRLVELNPRAEILLSQTAELSGDEESYWQAVVEEAAAAHLRELPGPASIASSEAIRKLPKALARRLVREAVRRVRGDLRQIEFEHIEAILALTGTAEGHGRVIVPGVDAMRSFDWLRLSPPGMDRVESRVQIVPLGIPGSTALPGGRGVIETRLGCLPESGYNEDQMESGHWERLDWEKLGGPLELRYWLPGDQYRPAGRKSAEKLKQMFQDAKVPLWERRFWPIIESSHGIVWTRGFGPSALHAAGDGQRSAGRRILEIREIR